MFLYESSNRAPTPLGQAPAPAPLSAVTDARGVPFRSICRVQVSTASGGASVGTGVLIGRHHVLTCAHLLYPSADPHPVSVTVATGEDGKPISSNGWVLGPRFRPDDCRTDGDDIALMRLAQPARTTPWPIEAFEPARLLDATVDLGGYVETGRNPNTFALRRSRGRVRGAIRIDSCSERDRNNKGSVQGTWLRAIDGNTKLLAHELASIAVMSGGPLWLTVGGRLCLVALQAGVVANGQLKTAVLLSPTVQAWIASSQRKLRPLG